MKDMIIASVNSLFENGKVEEIMEQRVTEAIDSAIKDIFGSWGKGTKLIKEKLEEQFIPSIEKYDYDKHILKLDSVLTEIVNKGTQDHNKLLENFKEFTASSTLEKITLEEIFNSWCEYCSENVETYDLDHDGESYDYIECGVEILRDEYKDLTLRFSCEQDDSLSVDFKGLFKCSTDKYFLVLGQDELNIASLRHMSTFEIQLLRIKNEFTKIYITEEELDQEGLRDEEVEVKASPYE